MTGTTLAALGWSEWLAIFAAEVVTQVIAAASPVLADPPARARSTCSARPLRSQRVTERSLTPRTRVFSS